MKNKILGIFVCMMLMVTAVPAVVSLKNNAINATVPSAPLRSMVAGWTELQKLLASDGAKGNSFGESVSVDGGTALIGGTYTSAVYVFTCTGNTWTQQQKLLALDGAAGGFGHSVSLDGDTALIGADLDDDNGLNSGSAYVFTRTGTTWAQQAKLLASDGAAWDQFGYSVSLDGGTALIGAHEYSDFPGLGSTYVFTRTDTTWTQQAKLLALDGAAGDLFGLSVSLSGDTALIGADLDDDNGLYSGSAYVFTRTGTTWTQQAKLLAAHGAAGDQFGHSVSLSGDTALIGAVLDDDNGPFSGSAYVFTRIGTTWNQQAKLLASDGAVGDQFGLSVSLSGDTALIGAYNDDDNEYDSGSAYVFTRTGTLWTQQAKLLASDGALGDEFGVSVSLDGDTALIGSWGVDDNGGGSGAAYVFTKGGIGIDITGGLGVNAVITNNNETVTITNINWEISVKGGILGMINKTIKGTIDVIEPGKSETVGTGLLFGLSPIAITVKVSDVEKKTEGTQFFILTIIKK